MIFEPVRRVSAWLKAKLESLHILQSAELAFLARACDARQSTLARSKVRNLATGSFLPGRRVPNILNKARAESTKGVSQYTASYPRFKEA